MKTSWSMDFMNLVHYCAFLILLTTVTLGRPTITRNMIHTGLHDAFIDSFDVDTDTVSYEHIHNKELYFKWMENIMIPTMFPDDDSDSIAEGEADPRVWGRGGGGGQKRRSECATSECATSDRATGDRATGDRATGDRATGECATGECATGECATGECVTSDRATSDRAPRSRSNAGRRLPLRTQQIERPLHCTRDERTCA
jgi:hypothetical protein